MARKTRRFPWTFLIQVATWLAIPVVFRLLSSGPGGPLLGYTSAVVITVGSALAVQARRVHRAGDTVRGALSRRRREARARVDSPDGLRAQAPLGAGLFALASFPAVFATLIAVPRAGGLDLPPTADARTQLCCVAGGALIAVAATDCWLGLGVSLRALAADGFTRAAVGCTIALAAAPPLMTLEPVGSRPAWIVVAAAQFAWPFTCLITGGTVSERRKRRLWRATDSAAAAASAAWSDDPGNAGRYDLILVSPGIRKIPVISQVRTVNRMGLKEAKDLIDNAPGVVLRQVTRDRADRARALLEDLGATLTISTTSPEGVDTQASGD